MDKSLEYLQKELTMRTGRTALLEYVKVSTTARTPTFGACRDLGGGEPAALVKPSTRGEERHHQGDRGRRLGLNPWRGTAIRVTVPPRPPTASSSWVKKMGEKQGLCRTCVATPSRASSHRQRAEALRRLRRRAKSEVESETGTSRIDEMISKKVPRSRTSESPAPARGPGGQSPGRSLAPAPNGRPRHPCGRPAPIRSHVRCPF